MSAFTSLFLQASGLVIGFGMGLAFCVLTVLGLVWGFRSVTGFLDARAEAMRRYAREEYVLEITWNDEQRVNMGRAYANPNSKNPAETVIWPKPISMNWKPRRRAS